MGGADPKPVLRDLLKRSLIRVSDQPLAKLTRASRIRVVVCWDGMLDGDCDRLATTTSDIDLPGRTVELLRSVGVPREIRLKGWVGPSLFTSELHDGTFRAARTLAGLRLEEADGYVSARRARRSARLTRTQPSIFGGSREKSCRGISTIEAASGS